MARSATFSARSWPSASKKSCAGRFSDVQRAAVEAQEQIESEINRTSDPKVRAQIGEGGGDDEELGRAEAAVRHERERGVWLDLFHRAVLAAGGTVERRDHTLRVTTPHPWRSLEVHEPYEGLLPPGSFRPGEENPALDVLHKDHPCSKRRSAGVRSTRFRKEENHRLACVAVPDLAEPDLVATFLVTLHDGAAAKMGRFGAVRVSGHSPSRVIPPLMKKRCPSPTPVTSPPAAWRNSSAPGGSRPEPPWKPKPAAAPSIRRRIWPPSAESSARYRGTKSTAGTKPPARPSLATTSARRSRPASSAARLPSRLPSDGRAPQACRTPARHPGAPSPLRGPRDRAGSRQAPVTRRVLLDPLAELLSWRVCAPGTVVTSLGEEDSGQPLFLNGNEKPAARILAILAESSLDLPPEGLHRRFAPAHSLVRILEQEGLTWGILLNAYELRLVRRSEGFVSSHLGFRRAALNRPAAQLVAEVERLLCGSRRRDSAQP